MKIIHLSSADAVDDASMLARSMAAAEAAVGHSVEVIDSYRGGLAAIFAPARLARRVRRGEIDRIVAHSGRDITTAIQAARLVGDAGSRVAVDAVLPSSAPIDASARRFIDECADVRLVDYDNAPEPFIPVIERVEKDPGAGRKLLFCGPLTPETGVDLLIRSFVDAAPRGWTLTIAGEGRGRFVMPLIRFVRTSGAPVEWTGPLPEAADLSAMIAQADMLAFTPRSPYSYYLPVAVARRLGVGVYSAEKPTTTEILKALSAEA
ncbi:MAG: hypothetical protein NC336_01345 [Clostridium sp.]|nr:hypothetical protein [Clostridium sp.]